MTVYLPVSLVRFPCLLGLYLGLCVFLCRVLFPLYSLITIFLTQKLFTMTLLCLRKHFILTWVNGITCVLILRLVSKLTFYILVFSCSSLLPFQDSIRTLSFSENSQKLSVFFSIFFFSFNKIFTFWKHFSSECLLKNFLCRLTLTINISVVICYSRDYIFSRTFIFSFVFPVVLLPVSYVC